MIVPVYKVEDGRLCEFMRDGILTGDDFLTAMGGENRYSVAPWGKLYTRSALKGIAFPSLICVQQTPFLESGKIGLGIWSEVCYNWFGSKCSVFPWRS